MVFYINSGLEITQHPEVSEKTCCLPDQWFLLPGDGARLEMLTTSFAISHCIMWFPPKYVELN